MHMKVNNDSKMSFAHSQSSSNRIFGRQGKVTNIENLEGVDLLGEMQLMEKTQPMQGIALLE